jgi:NAD-dependent histone deacetylase SIR2
LRVWLPNAQNVSSAVSGFEYSLNVSKFSSSILAEARIARSARTIKVGSLRPAIVLYDEPHPLGDDIATIQSADLARKPDMLIIMGTSLKVHGLKKLVKEFAKTVHSVAPSSPVKAKKWLGKVVFVNRTPPGAEWAGIIDYHVAGETDVWVEKVVEDWKKMRPADWEIQQTLVVADGDVSMNGNFKVVASTKNKTKGKRDSCQVNSRRILNS